MKGTRRNSLAGFRALSSQLCTKALERSAKYCERMDLTSSTEFHRHLNTHPFSAHCRIVALTETVLKTNKKQANKTTTTKQINTKQTNKQTKKTTTTATFSVRFCCCCVLVFNLQRLFVCFFLFFFFFLMCAFAP